MITPRLPLTLIPVTALANARTVLTPDQWDQVRSLCYSRAGHKCEACGTCHPSGSPTGAGGWEAHEMWDFRDAERIQRLDRILCLCQRCHAVTHFSFTRTRSGSDAVATAALEHLAGVNDWTLRYAALYVRRGVAICKSRSQRTWRLDLSVLREYGIELVGQDNRTLGRGYTRDMGSQTAGPEQFSPQSTGRTWWRRFLGTA